MGIGCSKNESGDLEDLYPQFAAKPKPAEEPTSEPASDAAPVQNGSGPPKSILRKTESTESGPESIEISRPQPQSSESPLPFLPSQAQSQAPQVPPPLPKHAASPPQSVPQASKQIDWNKLEREVQEDNYKVLKDDYTKNVHQFLVNQLLMSVQFFRNFERDREGFRSLKSDTEDQLNEMLAESKRKSIVHNAMYHKIMDYVGFKAKDGQVLEPLLPTEYYISYLYIESNRKEDYERLANGSQAYNEIDDTYYRVCVEESANVGYAKLRCIDGADAIAESVEDRSDVTELENEAPIATKSPLLLSMDTTQHQHLVPEKERLPTPVESKSRFEFKPALVNGKRNQGEEDEEDEDTFDGQPLTGAQMMERLRSRVERYSPVPRAPFDGKVSPTSPGSRLGAVVDQSEPVAKHRTWTPSSLPNAIDESNSAASRLNAPPKPPKASAAAHRAEAKGEKEKPVPTRHSNSESLTYALEEDAYGYVVNRAKNLAEIDLSFRSRRQNALPSKCFRKTQVADPSTTDPNDLYPPEELEAQTRIYLGSRHFMAYFASTFYDLARRMDKSSLYGSARILDPKIMCREDRQTEGVLPKETRLDFIPTLEVGFWPDDAIEWYLTRRRPKVRDNRTGTIYQWPPSDIVSQVQQIGFNLVPLGFLPAKGGAEQTKKALEEQSTQWLVKFTKVELLIQRTLNHPKLRCYLFALLLFKTFMSETDSISHTHIRYLFYWMVEKTPAGWVDERLGMNLMQLIREMKSHLMKEKFQHYFISKQNMFEHIPKHKLRRAQERFTRLQENIVPHIMVAIKRLHYEKGFYPMPDMDRLYMILTATTTLSILNPALLGAGEPPKGKNAFERNKEAASRGKAVDPTVERMRLLRRRNEERAAAERKAAEGPEPEKEKINVDVPLSDFDDTRRQLILEFFIEHFAAMARRSNEFRHYGQGLMYLMQAENLMRLLVECRFFGSSLHLDLKQQIEQLKQVARGNTMDYWNIAWGWDERPGVGGSFKAQSKSGIYGATAGISLPRIPAEPSPIPGTNMEAAAAQSAAKAASSSRLRFQDADNTHVTVEAQVHFESQRL